MLLFIEAVYLKQGATPSLYKYDVRVYRKER